MFRQLTIAAAISASLCPVTTVYAQENDESTNIERVAITG